MTGDSTRLASGSATAPLQDAYRRFPEERQAFGNAYSWYRQQAQRAGLVTFGRRRQFPEGVDGAFRDPWSERGIRVWKQGGRWVVDEEELEASIAEHRAALVEYEQLAVDYDRHILHGESGKRIDMQGGAYVRSQDFHRFLPAFGRPGKDSREHWICSRCFKAASMEHNKPECHRCEDWGGCGSDCTLSRVFCEACGTSKDI